MLDRIDKVLVEKEYDFINLSIGPQLPIEDDDVHAWTAVIDERLSRGTTLATIAVGNDGEGDAGGRPESHSGAGRLRKWTLCGRL